MCMYIYLEREREICHFVEFCPPKLKFGTFWQISPKPNFVRIERGVFHHNVKSKCGDWVWNVKNCAFTRFCYKIPLWVFLTNLIETVTLRLPFLDVKIALWIRSKIHSFAEIPHNLNFFFIYFWEKVTSHRLFTSPQSLKLANLQAIMMPNRFFHPSGRNVANCSHTDKMPVYASIFIYKL